MREHQLHFPDYDPSYPRRVSLEVKDLSQQIYGRALALWDRLELPFPEDPYQRGIGTFVSPTFSDRRPRICDVEIPEPIKPLLTRFGEAKRTGSKTTLPVPLIDLLPDICAEVYGQYPLNNEVEDHYGFLSLMPENFDYHQWLSSWWSDWWDHPQHIGWGVSMANIPKKGDSTSLSFSLTRKLKRLTTTRQYPPEIRRFPNPGLTTIATFRENYLYSLWQEELNGTFFKDPKGPIDEIYPERISSGRRQISWSEYQKGGGEWIGKTEDGWNRYLENVRTGKVRVRNFEGRFVKAKQAENYAYQHLQRWQQYIYNRYPQVFHYYSRSDEPGFVAELGYRASGSVGPNKSIFKKYIPKNPESYCTLSVTNTVALLEQFSNSLDV